MEKKMLKRILSIVMAIALIFTSVSLSWAVENISADTVTITDAQMVANAYVGDNGLTEEEAAVLANKGIVGKEHTIVIPTAEDDLITIDSEAKEITAADFKDGDYTWKAINASVVYEGGSEDVAITDGKGTFTYDGNNYSVDVTYLVSVEVDNQEVLTNAPYYLAQGVNNLEILANDCSSYLMLMQTIVPQMMALVDGSLGATLEDGAASTAIKSFNSQIEANGVMDLANLLEGEDGYLYADSKVEHLLTKGADIKKCMAETYEGAKAIAEDEGIQNIIEAALNVPAYKANANKLKTAVRQFSLMVNDMEPVYSDEWKALEVELVKEDADYASLDTVVEAAIGNSSEQNLDLFNPLAAAATKITANVNRFDVTVVLNAQIVPSNQKDDANLVSLETVSKTLTLSANTSAEDILTAIEESKAEVTAIAGWNAGINTDNYDRSVSVLPETLTEDIVYNITYTPKTYTVTFDYDGTKLDVPYGYNHTFEVSSDAATSYDYKVGEDTYMQGEVITVTKDLTVSRSEGKAREGFTIAEIIAEDYADVLSAKEEAILKSTALNSDVLNIRVVDNENTNQIVIEGQTITAKNYEAGVEGLTWKPAEAEVKKDGAVVETVDFDGNTAEFTSSDYDLIDVTYELVIKTGNDDTVLDLLNISNKLVEDAESQKADLAQVLRPTVYDNLGGINKTMLNAMAANLGAESQAAIEYVKAKAFNDATGTFYLYEYMTAYKNNGLTYYYQDNNYAKIKEQVVILAEQLEVVAKDPLLPALLDDLGYSDYKDRIDEAVAELKAIKDGFVAPNAAIKTESAELSKLVAAIEMEGTVGTYGTADGLKKAVVLTETASNRVNVSITVTVKDGTGKVVKTKTDSSITYVKGSTIADNSNINAVVAALEASLGVDKENYTCTPVGAIPENGTTIDSNVSVSYTWTPNTYTVSIEGEEDVTFTYDDAQIILPVCEEVGCTDQANHINYL